MTSDDQSAIHAPAASNEKIFLDCFALEQDPPQLRASGPLRGWMEAFPAKHAYRCLPLAMANTLGWEILCPYDLAVDWTGGPTSDDLRIRALEEDKPATSIATSHFSQGIVTFSTGYIFRTPQPWALLATGPLNNPKRGISPLTGLVETSWLPYPFTMNWALTEPGTVVFERGEPFCLIIPVERPVLDQVVPRVLDLSQDRVLEGDYRQFLNDRELFLRRLREGDPEAVEQAWQRRYFRGELPDGRRVEGHSVRSRSNSPEDRRRRSLLPDR